MGETISSLYGRKWKIFVFIFGFLIEIYNPFIVKIIAIKTPILNLLIFGIEYIFTYTFRSIIYLGLFYLIGGFILIPFLSMHINRHYNKNYDSYRLLLYFLFGGMLSYILVN